MPEILKTADGILVFENKEKNKVIFSENRIAFEFNSEKLDQLTYNSNLVKFVALIIQLGDFYDIKYSDLYIYVIEALNNNWKNVIKDQAIKIQNLKNQVLSLNDTNCILSHQIIELHYSKKNLDNKIKIYEDFYKTLFENIKNKDSISEILGIGTVQFEKIENLIKGK